MLTPEYLQGLPDELAALTENLETQLIEDIARRVAKAGEITDTAAYQIMRLKEMGASTEYIKKLLADYTKQSEEAIERMIFDAAQTDSEFYRTVYARTGMSYVPYEYNDYLQQLAVAAINQTKGELKNLTQSMGFAVRGSDGRVTFKPAAKAYQSAMDKAQMLVSTGGMDYITAVRMAVNDLAASGLRFVDYDSGVRNHADVAARRAILTGVSQMTGKIAEHNAAELGTDVVEVDAHAGARPDHAVWQGRWFSLTGKDKRYPLLSQATGYGTVTGLKGANCRHDFYPVIPGIDEPAYTEEELRNIDPPPVTIDGKTYTYYEAEQRQRAMERAIRKTKRQIIAAQASGDSEQFTAKSVLLRRQREQYADFSKKAGLVARNERTQIAEFGRSAGSKSSWAARKAKTKKGGSGSSGGHAVTVNVPTPADNGGKGKLYRDEGLTNGSGSASPVVNPSQSISSSASRTFRTKSELEKMPLAQLREETKALAKEYYSSGTSGISFGNADTDKAAEMLANSASKNALIKDYMSLKKRVSGLDKSGKSGIIEETIGRSLGAKAKNYDVYNPQTGEFVHLVEGSRITKPKDCIMAGKGRSRQIDEIDFLVNKYGGNPEDWQKIKGFGYVYDEYGEERKVELHWYEEPTVGKVKMKIKERNGEIYIDDD